MNPWLSLPAEVPFVLGEDSSAIAQFNGRATERTRIETTLLPEPFVGRLDAPILLLALNPGVSDGDFALHKDAAFQNRVRLCHRSAQLDWPYYYLDPGVSGPHVFSVRLFANSDWPRSRMASFSSNTWPTIRAASPIIGSSFIRNDSPSSA